MSTHFISQLVICAALYVISLTTAHGTAYPIAPTNTSASATINGAQLNCDNIPSGSGGYADMLRIQANGTDNGNNDESTTTPLPNSQKSGVAVASQTLSGMPVVTIGGTQYIQLNFDTTDSTGLTLADFRMHVNTTGGNVYANDPHPAGLSRLGTPGYDFNASGANALRMAAFKSDGGTDDMTVNTPLGVVVGKGIDFDTAIVYFFASSPSSLGGFGEFVLDESPATTVGTRLLPPARTIWGGASMAVLALGGMVVARRRKVTFETVAAAA